jgi:endonuclease/exonuclease/phosphatase family metal-dependent hydrolase
MPQGVAARKCSSELLVARLNQLMADKGPNGAHDKIVVVLGDLNSPASEDGYQVLTGHRYVSTGPAYASTQLPISNNAAITFLDSRHALFRRSATDTLSTIPAYNSLLGAPFGEHFTYTGFSSSTRQTLIDYILFANNGAIRCEECDRALWHVEKYGVIPNHFGDGVWVSDHRMVTVILSKS